MNTRADNRSQNSDIPSDPAVREALSWTQSARFLTTASLDDASRLVSPAAGLGLNAVALTGGNIGQLIDPAARQGPNSTVHRLAAVPVAQETYDPKQGPPSRQIVRQWAAECGGLSVFDSYPSIMLSVQEAHHNGCDPRQALEQKIARLRERSHERTR